MEFQTIHYSNGDYFGPDMDELFKRDVLVQSSLGWILVAFAYNTGSSTTEYWYITAVYKRKL